MSKRILKFTSLLVIIVLLISQASATQPMETEEIAPLEKTTELGVPYSEIPLELNPAQIEQAGHTARLREEETMPNTAVFLNEDGTRTLYYFPNDIWYEDTNGVKKDYTTTLQEATAKEKTVASAAFKADGGSGELLLPNKVTAETPVTYRTGDLVTKIAPTYDRVISHPIKYTEAPAADQDPAVVAPNRPEKEELTLEEIYALPNEQRATEWDLASGDLFESPDNPAVNLEYGPDEIHFPKIKATESNEPIYARMEDNTVASVKLPKETVLQKTADFLTNAKAARLESNISAQNGRLVESVRYERAIGSADFVCKPLVHGFANEFVLQKDGGEDAFSFVLTLEGLTPYHSTGYSIPLVDENGYIETYIILEGLTDANGVTDPGSVIDIAPYGDGQYLVTVNLNRDFLEAPDTQYPVVTRVTANFGSSYINDSHVAQNAPSVNYASSPSMYAGYSGSYVYYSYIQVILKPLFDNGTITKPVDINSAYFYIRNFATTGSSVTLNGNIARNVWNYQTITYNNRPGFYTENSWNGVDRPASVACNTSSSHKYLPCLDFTQALIRNYMDQNLWKTIHENRGFVLNVPSGLRQFYSTNNSSSPPYIQINYVSAKANSYRSISTNLPNCWRYSMLYNNGTYEPPLSGLSDENQEAANRIIYNTQSHLRQNGYPNATARAITGWTAPIYDGEYRIAFRFSVDGGTITAGNYHFIYELSTGQWAGKYANQQSWNHGFINPNLNEVGQWDAMATSKTYYMAVKLS